MRFNEDKRIKTDVPFLKDKTVLYVGRSPDGEVLNESVLDTIAERFEEEEYTFLYLPELVENLSPEMVQYMFPGQDADLSIEDMYGRIRQLAKLDDVSGFLYKQNDLTYFHTVSFNYESELLDAVFAFICTLCGADGDRVLFSKKLKSPSSILGSQNLPAPMEFAEEAACYECEPEASEEPHFSFSRKKKARSARRVKEEEELDPRIQAILEEWERMEQKFGITIQDLDIILGYRVKLSRLMISKTNEIRLADWEGEPVVKMDDLTKTLYFFYLKHPEGAVLKDLQLHEKEFLTIYMRISGREDLDGIRESVGRMIHPYSTNRDTNMSRIRKAFRDIVGERAAKFYYIDGKMGGNYTIHLDRDLVIWEY